MTQALIYRNINKMLYISIAISVLVIGTLNIITYINRCNSSRKNSLTVRDIKNDFFSEMNYEKFITTWPKFCEMAGTPGAHQHLDDKILILEKYHPISDLLYENIADSISVTDFGSDSDIHRLTVRELFLLFYDAQNNIVGSSE